MQTQESFCAWVCLLTFFGVKNLVGPSIRLGKQEKVSSQEAKRVCVLVLHREVEVGSLVHL